MPSTARDSAEVSCVTTLPSALAATCIRLSALAAVCTNVSSWLIAEFNIEACPAATGLSESEETASPDESSLVNFCSASVELFKEATSPLT